MAAHVMVVPYPGQGLLNPMMQLARRLASNGITVSFVVTESWHKIISGAEGDAFTSARKQGLPLSPAIIPDCVAPESERSANLMAFFLSLANMEAHVSQLITKLARSENPPVCMVADTFLRWAVPLAKKHALKSVSLWTESVTRFSIFYHSDLVVGVEGCIDNIPGVPPLQHTDLPSPFVTPLRVEFLRCFDTVKEADWIVANSMYPLDCKAVEALFPKIRVHCVGSLLPCAYLEQSDNQDRKMGTSSRIETDCKLWLDCKPAQSVIYVSFGSHVSVSRPQLAEIAAGLMQSGYHFVWALRPDKDASDVSEMLPPGFLDETKEQGLVAPWFSQVEVLSHPSVGGFLSHCGWNAIMESVSSGIPILGFPIGLDQFTNCKLIADEWNFGLQLRRGDDGNRVISAQEITKKIKLLMEGEESVRVRRAAERFRDAAKEEVSKGGRSANNLEALVNSLKQTKVVSSRNIIY
ncbi:hypothetical protein SUGI_0373060 [Cryptomeria japonica]|uniref:UDP-glycosyltransferase 86A1 n=1 Tax=Cryptomeria japonica TaxID=3369 RepID=UPI002408B219|nr:UDP-glycosyltransferase 86A1 [Cryptomeria japonica]GLJ20497.1 hypothetical protein SUGI_0373060 [Cryptomeria japonica]